MTADHYWTTFTSSTTLPVAWNGSYTQPAYTYAGAQWPDPATGFVTPAPAKEPTALEWLDAQVESVCARGRLTA